MITPQSAAMKAPESSTKVMNCSYMNAGKKLRIAGSTRNPAQMCFHLTFASALPLVCFSASTVEYAIEAMLVTLAKPTNSSVSMPRIGPPSGTIHTVGSGSPSMRPAAMPTICASTVPMNSPPHEAHTAARGPRVSLARVPMTGHHESPAPRLNSTAIMKLSCSSSNGATGGAASRSAQEFCDMSMTIMKPTTTMRPGATKRLSLLIVTGPRESTIQPIRIASSANTVTMGP